MDDDVQIIISDHSLVQEAEEVVQELQEVPEQPLVTGIKSFLNGEFEHDVEICCADKKVIKAHRLILGASSPLLKEALLTVPDTEDVFKVVLPDVNSNSLLKLLQSIYGGPNEPAVISYELEFLGIEYHQDTGVQKPEKPRKRPVSDPEIEPELVKKRFKPTSKKRSLAWTHFTPLSPRLAQCDVCKLKFSTPGSSTTLLSRHLSKHHPELYQKILANKPLDEGIAKVTLGPSSSLVWDIFKNQDGLAQCTLCPESFNMNECSSTSKLLRHCQQSHAIKFEELKARRNSLEKEALMASIQHPIWQHFSEEIGNVFKCKTCFETCEMLALEDHLSSLHLEYFQSYKLTLTPEHENLLKAAIKVMEKQTFLNMSHYNIWSNYAKVSDEEAKCKLCETTLKCYGNYKASLLRHFKLCHGQAYRQFRQGADVFDRVESGPEAVVNPQVWSRKSVTVDEITSSFEKHEAGLKCKECEFVSLKNEVKSLESHLIKCHQALYESLLAKNPANNAKLAKGTPSVVWNFFTMVTDDSSRCKMCDTICTHHQGSTTGMRRHLVRYHQVECQKFLGQLEELELSENHPIWQRFDETFKCFVCEESAPVEDPKSPLLVLEEHLKSRHINLYLEYETEKASLCYIKKSEAREDSGKTAKRRSAAWFFFNELNASTTQCKGCSTSVKTNAGSTSLMIRHLKAKHDVWYQEFLSVKGTKALPVLPDLPVVSDREKPYDEVFVEVEPGSKRSAVWHFFTREDKASAVCRTCDQTVKQPSGNTSVLFRHLQRHHPSKYQKFLDIRQSIGLPEIKPQKVKGRTVLEKPNKATPTWNFFTRTETGATCNTCLEEFQIQNGTTTQLLRHLKASHPPIFSEYLSAKDGQDDHGLEGKILKDFFTRINAELIKCSTCDCSLKNQGSGTEIKPGRALWSHLRVAHSDLHDKVRAEQVDIEESLKLRYQDHPIWKHFQSLDMTSAMCLACEELLQASESTLSLSKLEEHLHEQHHQQYEGFNKEMKLESVTIALKKVADSSGRSGVAEVLWQHYKEFGDKHVRCLSCSTVLSSGGLSKLLNHLRVNHGQLIKTVMESLNVGECICKTCDSVFATTTAMVHHASVFHEGKSPYKCNQCDRTFVRSDVMAKHKSRHNSVFLCTFCGAQFTSKPSRHRHEQFSHLDIRKMGCTYCNRKVPYSSTTSEPHSNSYG